MLSTDNKVPQHNFVGIQPPPRSTACSNEFYTLLVLMGEYDYIVTQGARKY